MDEETERLNFVCSKEMAAQVARLMEQKGWNRSRTLRWLVAQSLARELDRTPEAVRRNAAAARAFS